MRSAFRLEMSLSLAPDALQPSLICALLKVLCCKDMIIDKYLEPLCVCCVCVFVVCVCCVCLLCVCVCVFVVCVCVCVVCVLGGGGASAILYCFVFFQGAELFIVYLHIWSVPIALVHSIVLGVFVAHV